MNVCSRAEDVDAVSAGVSVRDANLSLNVVSVLHRNDARPLPIITVVAFMLRKTNLAA